RQASIQGNLVARDGNLPRLADASWGGWEVLEGFEGDLHCDFSRFKSPSLVIDEFQFSAWWRPPLLELPGVSAHLYNGDVTLKGRLNVASRRVEARGYVDVDLHHLGHLFGKESPEWLEESQWTSAPKVDIRVEATLPAWTNAQPDWV